MNNAKKHSNILQNVGISAVVVAAAAAVIWLAAKPNQTAGQYDTFARCLAEKKITMYGANWCPHCQTEKKSFGSSWQYVPYVECPDEPKLCLEKGITGYPTWIMPDGRKLEGEQGLRRLARESGCTLPEIKNNYE